VTLCGFGCNAVVSMFAAPVMAADVERTCYDDHVSRYTTSAFMRLKLGDALARNVAPHIFETSTDAHRFVVQ
jgi:propionate CoA-transferase